MEEITIAEGAKEDHQYDNPVHENELKSFRKK